MQSYIKIIVDWVRVMVFNATFNNISVISWRSVLFVEEPEYSEKTTDLSEVTDNLYHIMLYQAHLTWVGFKLTTLVVIGIDCIGSCKSNYHTITTTTVPDPCRNYRNDRHACIAWLYQHNNRGINKLTSAFNTFLVVKSFAQSIKHISVSLLYCDKNSLNYKW